MNGWHFNDGRWFWYKDGHPYIQIVQRSQGETLVSYRRDSLVDWKTPPNPVSFEALAVLQSIVGMLIEGGTFFEDLGKELGQLEIE